MEVWRVRHRHGGAVGAQRDAVDDRILGNREDGFYVAGRKRRTRSVPSLVLCIWPLCRPNLCKPCECDMKQAIAAFVLSR